MFYKFYKAHYFTFIQVGNIFHQKKIAIIHLLRFNMNVNKFNRYVLNYNAVKLLLYINFKVSVSETFIFLNIKCKYFL